MTLREAMLKTGLVDDQEYQKVERASEIHARRIALRRALRAAARSQEDEAALLAERRQHAALARAR